MQLLVDVLVSYALLDAVFWVRFESGRFASTLSPADYPVYQNSFWSIILVLVFFLRSNGLYGAARHVTFATETGRVVKAVAAATLAMTAVTFFVRDFSFSRTFFVTAGAVLAFGLSVSRFLLGLAVMGVDRKRGSQRNVLIVGSDDNARKLVRFYARNPRFSTRVAGYLDDTAPVGTEIDGIPVLGKMGDIAQFVRFRREIHEVVLAAPGASAETVLKIIYECEREMVTFRWIADVFGLITSKMSVSYLGGVPILAFSDSPLSEWENRVLKRVMDIVLSAAFLFVCAPFLALIALWVRMDSPGPVFLVQQRVGQDGRRFLLYKFRTMRADAEKESGPVWASENDPRRTRSGAVLRRLNLDELPQFWNVFVGDMSLVGPRPERPHFVSQFKEDIPRYMARHSIRSGLTGWAQVNGLRGNTSIEERTKYDLFYIENWSVWLDLKIICMTAFRLFSSPNAY